MYSPFDNILDKSSIPFVFQEQFLFSADAPYTILVAGKMNRVWHQPGWLWPLLWFLSWFDMLFPETGTDINASMQIIGRRNKKDEPYHRWNRTFVFPRVYRYFNAVMIYHTGLQAVVERMGPAGLVQIQWCIEFSPPMQINISTVRCFLVIGRFQMRLPALFHPSVCAVETAIAHDTLHIVLTVSHPWLGDIFGYDGDFQVTRVALR